MPDPGGLVLQSRHVFQAASSELIPVACNSPCMFRPFMIPGTGRPMDGLRVDIGAHMTVARAKGIAEGLGTHCAR